jgi:hypothetical protein
VAAPATPRGRRLFGTDGIRGVAGERVTAELALSVARAATERVVAGGQVGSPRVLVVRDTRESGDMLEAAVAAGVTAAGGDALLGGVLPTPAAPLLVRRRGLDLGVVLSASHNPFHDNGIKFFGPDGYKLSDAEELEIERALDAPPPLAAPAPPRRSGAFGATKAAMEEARLDGGRIELASLEGDWCSDLVIYDGLPPLQWALVSPQRMRISYPVLAGTSRGEVRTKEEAIQPLDDGKVRLVTDNPKFFAETVYAVERRALRGVSQRRVDKATGVEKTMVPDSFRRCEPMPVG